MDAQGFITVHALRRELGRRIEAHGIHITKIASCSFTDWPLLERIAAADKPAIASTAGATLDEIDNGTSFFLHRARIHPDELRGRIPHASTKPLQVNQIEAAARPLPGRARLLHPRIAGQHLRRGPRTGQGRQRVREARGAAHRQIRRQRLPANPGSDPRLA